MFEREQWHWGIFLPRRLQAACGRSRVCVSADPAAQALYRREDRVHSVRGDGCHGEQGGRRCKAETVSEVSE